MLVDFRHEDVKEDGFRDTLDEFPKKMIAIIVESNDKKIC
jgi:hypothetical protein